MMKDVLSDIEKEIFEQSYNANQLNLWRISKRFKMSIGDIANIREKGFHVTKCVPTLKFCTEKEKQQQIADFLKKPKRIWTDDDFGSDEYYKKLAEEEKVFLNHLGFVAALQSNKEFMDAYNEHLHKLTKENE